MGVQGLWRVLEPTAKPVQLANLRGKVLAIDASIWIYHFLKAMRDSKGTILAAAHIIGFFRRICKLLFFEIRPVFVFDGAAPLLKKQTTQKRGERRQGREVNARATANKLLTLQLQRAAQQEKQKDASSQDVQVSGTVPSDAVYLDQLSGQGRSGTEGASQSAEGLAMPANFVRMDQYHLPDLNKIAPVSSNDQRMLTEEELQEYSRNFSAQARAGFIDTSTVDFHSTEFQRLPIETQYQLLNMARLKSRLRMGYTAEELENMFPNEMDFSRFQINRVTQRNFFTQRLMNLVGMEEDLTRRVSSEKNKEYMLKRNEEGWTLSLEDSTKGAAARDTSSAEISEGAGAPVDLNSIADKEIKHESSDDEFEDVDIAPLAPVDNADAEQPETATQENDMDLSVEDSARLDELFGFEAKLSREDLYNKMMQEVSASDQPEGVTDQKATKPKDWKPRSFLFGNATAKPPMVDANNRDSAAPRAAQTAPIDEATKAPEKPAKPSPASLPWFETTGDNFEEMRIQDKQEDPHLVPYEEALRNLNDSDEEDFEEVDLTREQPKSGKDKQNVQTDRSVVKGPSLRQSPPAENISASNITIDSDEVQTLANPRENITDAGPRSSATTPPFKGSPVHTPAEADTSVVNLDAAAHAAAPEFAVTAGTNESVDQSGLSGPTGAPGTPVLGAEHERAARAKPSELEVITHSESERKVLPATSAASVDSSKDGQQGTSSDPQVAQALSPEAAERAEEEAKAAVDEDEDIAAMLIAEAEENERFAKELAEQNHKTWTEADQLDYNDQISTLRNQFAKETRDADTVTQEMVQECQELLQFFGIPYITAPGEAEAQCAELRHLKLVDGVVTDDGDTFLFDDDTVVYRNMFSQSRFVECYTTKQIKEKLGLDRRRLIDLAFLLGSDYTEGIIGIGPVTGVEILAEFGSLEEFGHWWTQTQRFPDNADLDTRLRRRLYKQFKSKLFLPEDFPSQSVTDAYLHPIVDKDATKFNWGLPDIDGLRKFMSVAAGWSIEKINMALLPVVQEAKRRELQRKTGAAMSQSSLDDYYSAVVQNPELQSKRAAKATNALRKRIKK